jgi:outer membrane protein assembly factor BamB
MFLPRFPKTVPRPPDTGYCPLIKPPLGINGAGYVPSPILHGDHLYVINDHGLLTCFDARTGALVYESQRPQQPGDYLSSPVAFRGNIFITNTDGSPPPD